MLLCAQHVLLLLAASCVTGFGTSNNPPRFVLPEHELLLQVKEGTSIGTLIYTLVGSDPEGDELMFGVRGQVGTELLSIDKVNRTTAHVYLKKELDRETQDDYQFILTLSDGSRENVIEQSMQILVLDINDNRPVFNPYNSTIYIKEGWPPGIIATFEAIDLDEGSYGQVLYNLKEEDDYVGNFKIETILGKGVLSLKRTLDYEMKSLYQLQILAIDRPSTGRRNSGTAAVIVQVIDVEDQPPQFLKSPTVTKVPEDAPVGLRVLEVKAVDGDRGVDNPIRYSIITENCPFAIDNRTGVIYVERVLDRESSRLNGAYVMKIKAEEFDTKVVPAATAETEVTIMLIDINDETPRFRNSSYVGEINENAQLHVPVLMSANNLPEVYDYDQGANGTFKLSIDDDYGIFEITPSVAINQASFLLRVNNQSLLDYEKIKNLKIKIIARETIAINPKSSTAEVTINIRDANDNIPEFDIMEYTASVREDVIPGTIIAKISAHDLDSGNYGTAGIRYTDLRGHIAEYLSLDPITGAIIVKSGGDVFDREQMSTYFVTVVVRDNLGFGNRNTAQLQINIEDVNDNAPEFLRKSYEVRVEENEPTFSHPFFVEAYDRDLEGSSNSEILFEIIEGDAMKNFSINSSTGEIRIKSPLDFEAMNSTDELRYFNLTVRAKDMGIPPLFNNVTVTIYVQDRNDYYPAFTESSYVATVREDIRPGDPIIQIHAYDNDGSFPNNQVVYRLLGESQDKFQIDVHQGVISVAQGSDLDPDSTDPKTKFYTLNVAAFDGGLGTDQKYSLVNVSINVNDVNNKAPVFKEIKEILLKENVPFGTVIYKLIAIDRDDDPDLRFTIDPNKCEARNEDGFVVSFSTKDYSGLFEVTPEGFVQVKGIIDRETVETFKLRVVVEDRNAVGFRQTATSTIPIRIEDVNDNDPYFRQSLYRRVLAENSKPGTAIEGVTAFDKDINRTLSYQLHRSSKIAHLINVDNKTGGIVVKTKIDREQHPWLNFTIRATDSGLPPRSGFTNVSVQVLDENDNNPVFSKDTYTFYTPEDAPIGSVVGVVSATDADAGAYAKLTYILDKRTTAGKFSINVETGAILVTDTLDRETQDKYILVVEVWDNYDVGYLTGESRNAFKQINVIVTDQNDQTPALIKAKQCAMVTEYHAVGDTVAVIKAKDTDDPTTANSYVDFTIVAGNQKGLFGVVGIDLNTAKLIAFRSLKQQIGNHTLTVQVRDRGQPPRASSDDVVVCIEDFNDHSPRFVKPFQNHTIRVAEDTAVGTSLFQVEALDDDVGANGQVRYKILRDPRDDWKSFAIGDSSGLVVLQKPLDREIKKNYLLRIEARDLGVPTPLASDMEVHLYVKNVIDVEPRFKLPQITIHFTENVDNETVLLPDTEDLEEYESGSEKVSVCFFIISGNDENVFKMDALQHRISVTSRLDRELRDSYTLFVKATKDCNAIPSYFPNDKVKNYNSSVLKINVKVKDVNDNGPKFIKEIFTGGMTTDTVFGTVIMKIEVVDSDIGENARPNFYIDGPIDNSLVESIGNLATPAFIINQTSGEILLNFYPQKQMKGYFHFKLKVNDSDGFNDSTEATIYLVREDQKYVFTVRLTPKEFRPQLHRFQRHLSNQTGTIVNIDAYKLHENSDGSVDGTKTDIFLHFVQAPTNSVMNVKAISQMIQQHVKNLNEMYKEFNVLEVKPAVGTNMNSTPEEILITWLIGASACFGVLFIVALSACVAQRSRYERQIKAATALAFGSQESNLSRSTVPNTNQHSTEGSNPIWMHSYENEWYKEGDEVSTGSTISDEDSDGNSLDENVINEVQLQADENHSQTSTTVAHDHRFKGPSQVRSNGTKAKVNNNNSAAVVANGTKTIIDPIEAKRLRAAAEVTKQIKQQNNLNKIQSPPAHRHRNIYESLGLNGQSLSAHIETTEL